MNNYTDYSINTCFQCNTPTNNLVFCDSLCRRMCKLFNRKRFRKDLMPESFVGKEWDWHLSEEERKTASIYQLETTV